MHSLSQDFEGWLNSDGFPPERGKHNRNPGSREWWYHKVLMVIDNYNFVGVMLLDLLCYSILFPYDSIL